MFEHKKIQKLEDLFLGLSSRPGRCVYFYRICGYTKEIGQFIADYYQAARRSGVIQAGKIPNPDERVLSYYEEMMGTDLQVSLGAISADLERWLPRMDGRQRENVAASLYDALDSLRRAGKNTGMLKNAYIKFMCWMYYKFERIVDLLGEETVPKILYEGEVSRYELMLLSILSNAGCDVILLQYRGDAAYRKLDADSVLSDNLELPGMTEFPSGFSLRKVEKEFQASLQMERACGQGPKIANCTNAWITGKGLADICTAETLRGEDPRFFYNCFYRINGVEDKLTYLSQLYQFRVGLKNSGRRMVIISGGIPSPTVEEISSIRRADYTEKMQMLLDLSKNIMYLSDQGLQRVMIQAFLDVLRTEAESPGTDLNRLTNKAVYLLCWLKRYQGDLFSGWKMPKVACFVYMGGCRDGREAAFMRFLARLPIDVLVLRPDLDRKCCLQDELLYEITFTETMAVHEFPREDMGVHMGTAAYHAERELDTLMYQDFGIYREQQYQKAETVVLQTTYEEIRLLWDEEVKYRPNFSTVGDTVHIPVIFAKVSGVKDGQIPQYWQSVRELVTEDTYVVKNVPFIAPAGENPMKAYAVGFLENGKIQKRKIREHPHYPYGYLREGAQEHILEKLQVLIDRRTIKGTFENGTEYTIISTVLDLPKDIVRMIQRFDFTKKNPKLLYIHTTETVISLEDSILTAFLDLIGFDIVFFVPTGYETIEKHFNRRIMEGYQIGEYVYDLRVPGLESFSPKARTRWMDKIFKRGR